jgi:chemotaxis protein MotB
MARKQHHEEHLNHEAWAIPYGDLLTLLLAFFVVMYAISSINEGKYRVMADALSSAFGGRPRTIQPIQLGETQLLGSSFDRPSLQTPDSNSGPAAVQVIDTPRMLQVLDMPSFGRHSRDNEVRTIAAAQVREAQRRADANQQLQVIGKRIQQALSKLVEQKLVTVRRGGHYLEVEIRSDILFASGVATPSPLAIDTVRRLAGVLGAEPNAVRVEGYTDNQPISTARFPSNWELSAARAASVVHELIAGGVAPQRLAMVGYGEHQPVADNATAEGRNANRRVLLVILASPQGPDAITDIPNAVADAEAPAGEVAGAQVAVAAGTPLAVPGAEPALPDSALPVLVPGTVSSPGAP